MKIKGFERIDWKKTRKSALWGLAVSIFILTVGFTSHKQSRMPCSDIRVTITDTLGQGFIDSSDVVQMVTDKFGVVTGKPVHSINMSLLEKIINNNPFVARAEVFSTIDGKLNIEVNQRRPIVRIVNANNESFYIDDQGVFMPLSDKYSAHVLIANGFISDKEAAKKLRKITEEDMADTSLHITSLEKVYRVAEYIQDKPFWNAQIEQVYVDDKGELELIPRIGSHTVLIGDGRDLDAKFRKLFLFYKEGLNKTGWNQYSLINLKYENQVVCTKK